MKANNFKSKNCIYCCTQQLLSTPSIKSKTHVFHNTDSSLTNTLLPGSATFDAVKYPVELDSSPEKYDGEEG